MEAVENKSVDSQILKAAESLISQEQFDTLPEETQEEILKEAWAMASSTSPDDFEIE